MVNDPERVAFWVWVHSHWAKVAEGDGSFSLQD